MRVYEFVADKNRGHLLAIIVGPNNKNPRLRLRSDRSWAAHEMWSDKPSRIRAKCSLPLRHFVLFFHAGLVCQAASHRLAETSAIMDMIQNAAVAEKEEATLSANSSRLVVRLNDDTTKGGFVSI